MRICVAGVGAVGSTVAARLAAANAKVHLLARGARFHQIRRDGLRVDVGDKSLDVEVPVSDRPDFGVQDIVFIATKVPALTELLPSLQPLIGPQTFVAPLINGIPWWYFQRAGGRFEGDTVAAVDPSGALCSRIPAERIIGCVVYLTAKLLPSGRVNVTGRQRVVVGSISHERCEHADALADLLSGAGIGSASSTQIRNDLWTKVALNLATNPLSVVTETTLQDQFTDPALLPIVRSVLDETVRVARGYGAEPTMSMEEMIATGRNAGAFETSMLQDYRAGRVLELDAIGHSVLELAGKIGEAMPTTQRIIDRCAHRVASRNPLAPSQET
jgi:2-dehydropantoate 2-reductase